MKKLIFLFTIILVSCQNKGQIQTDDLRLTGIDAQIDSLLIDYRTVGVAVAVIENGKTIYAKGFGYRDFEKKIPADVNTIFGIGSCTKAFTGALFGILEDQNKLALSDSPIKYIPELKFATATMDANVQLKNLLNHTSGMPATSTESSAVLFGATDKYDMIERLHHLPPAAQVGESFMYNNMIYTLAGMVTERITSRTWEENLSDLIFKPLGTSNTYANAYVAANDPNFSLGYAVDSITGPVPVLIEDIPMRSAGGNIYSSVDDMTKWISVWMNNGLYNGEQLLSENYIKEATSKIQPMSNEPPTDSTNIAHYGYGWMNNTYNGRLKIEHSGGISGYTSNVVMFPEDDLAIVVLSNQTISGISYRITDVLTNRLLGIEDADEAPEPNYGLVYGIDPIDTPTIINKDRKPSHALNDFEGTYAHPGFGEFTISFSNGTLYADFPFTKFRLTHEENNVFIDHFTEEEAYVYWNFLRFNFQANADGIIDSVLLNVDQDPVSFRKK